MKILYIIPYIPFPLHSGGNQAFFNMADEARKEHEISLLLHVQNDTDECNLDKLKKVWPDVHFYVYRTKVEQHITAPIIETPIKFPKRIEFEVKLFDKVRKSMERKINRRYNRFRPHVPEVEYTKDNVKEKFVLGEHVRAHSTLFNKTNSFESDYLDFVYETSRKGFDCIQVEFFECLPLIYLLPDNTETVFVHHELRFVRIENEMSLFSKVTAADKMCYHTVKDAELSMLKLFRHVIVLTETDKHILSSLLPDTDIYVSPALTDAAKIKEISAFEMAKDLIFIGSGDHYPNADGVLWFCQDVVPVLKQKKFNGQVKVIGKWNEEIKTTVRNLFPDIKFTGYIEDLRTFINGNISIVPIRIGSGMRMKILDSAAAAMPIVTTSKGCEGMSFKDGTDYLIADTAEDFANAIMNLQKDERLQKRLVENAGAKLYTVMDGDELIARRMDFYKNIEHK